MNNSVVCTVLGPEIMLVCGSVEVCCCCCLPLLPQLACNIPTTTYKYYFRAKYTKTLTTSETIDPCLLKGLGKRSSLPSTAAAANAICWPSKSAAASPAALLRLEQTLLSLKSRWRTAGDGLHDLPLAENSLLGSSETRREERSA